MADLGNIFRTASGVFALIPGVIIIITNLGVPPEQSKLLFGGIVETISVLSLLLLYINKESIKKSSAKQITFYSLTLGILGLLLLFTYIALFNNCLTTHENYDSVFYPLYANGELLEKLTKYNKYQLISHYGRDEVLAIINESSGMAMNITNLFFLILYTSMFVFLVLAFGLVGVKYQNES